MQLIPADTTPEAYAKQMEVFRRMSIADRAARTFAMSDHLREVVAAGIRHRHSDWSEHRVKREQIRLFLGDELFNKTFGRSQGA